jgi:hypothetical protein
VHSNLDIDCVGVEINLSACILSAIGGILVVFAFLIYTTNSDDTESTISSKLLRYSSIQSPRCVVACCYDNGDVCSLASLECATQDCNLTGMLVLDPA